MASNSRFMRMVVAAHGASGAEPKKKAIYNTFDYRRTNIAVAPSKAAFQAAFIANVLTPLAGLLSVSWIVDTLSNRLLDDALDPFLTNASTIVGTVAGDSLPSINTAYVKLSTGFRLSASRGAKHFGPIAEADTLLDSLNGTALTAWGTFLTSYLAGFTDATAQVWQPYLVSAKQSTLKGTQAIVVGNLITGAAVNAVLGKMERRKMSFR